MEATGLTEPLTTKLWDALSSSRQPIAETICWFFQCLEQRLPADIPDQLTRHKQRVRPRQWVELVEGFVAQGTLTRQEATTITDHLLTWTAADGTWKR